jgi:hypothetical protein
MKGVEVMSMSIYTRLNPFNFTTHFTGIALQLLFNN